MWQNLPENMAIFAIQPMKNSSIFVKFYFIFFLVINNFVINEKVFL